MTRPPELSRARSDTIPAFSCKQWLKYFKELSEKLADAGSLGGKDISCTRKHLNGRVVLL